MAPVKKRARLAPKAADSPKDEVMKEAASSPKEELRLHEDAVSQFLDDVDAIVNEQDKSNKSAIVTRASTTLLSIRSLQLKLLNSMQETQKKVQEKRSKLEQEKLALQNLLYEETYLKRTCQTLRDYETPQLEKMCRDEVVESNDTMSEDTTTEQIMNQFLCGSSDESHSDPNQHRVIMAKLHKELNLRGSLERDLHKAQADLVEKKRQVKQKKEFLQDLPKKLRDMELSSLPLQKFFLQHEKKEDSTLSITHLLGTERQELLEKALALLPAPLYTLFVQLQSYWDAFVDMNLSLEISSTRKKTTSLARAASDERFQPKDTCLLLHLPVPDIKEMASSAGSVHFLGSNKRITVHFEYFAKLQIVTARAFGCEDKVNVSNLLQNLFPGDDGAVTLNGSNLMVESDGGTTPMTSQDLVNHLLPHGRPYHWCNYIAGLQFPQNQHDDGDQPLQHNTKAVMNALFQRLRANATLQYLLYTMEKRKPNPIPMHPSMAKSNGTCNAKLVGWTQESTTTDSSKDKNSQQQQHKKSYLAMIRRKSATLRATVTIDMVRYPAIAPVWSLTGTQESWGDDHGSVKALQDGSNPLYDESLGKLEDIVNGSIETLVIPDVEETYEWILAHQLRKLVEEWDSMQKLAEEGK